jgi:hypothetical protein
LGHIKELLNDDNYEARFGDSVKEESRLMLLKITSKIRSIKRGNG